MKHRFSCPAQILGFCSFAVLVLTHDKTRWGAPASAKKKNPKRLCIVAVHRHQISGGNAMRRLLIGLLPLAIILFWNARVVTAQFSEVGVEKFRVPVEAPEFTLKDLNGNKVSLKELRGRVIILNFFASW
jgi:hypothetical protein